MVDYFYFLFNLKKQAKGLTFWLKYSLLLYSSLALYNYILEVKMDFNKKILPALKNKSLIKIKELLLDFPACFFDELDEVKKEKIYQKIKENELLIYILIRRNKIDFFPDDFFSQEKLSHWFQKLSADMAENFVRHHLSLRKSLQDFILEEKNKKLLSEKLGKNYLLFKRESKKLFKDRAYLLDDTYTVYENKTKYIILPNKTKIPFSKWKKCFEELKKIYSEKPKKISFHEDPIVYGSGQEEIKFKRRKK